MQPVFKATVIKANLVSMKKILLAFIAGLVCIVGFGQQSEVRTPGSFSGIKAGEAVDVYLKKGDKESVKVETTGSTSNVLTEISGTYLKIHMSDGRFKNQSVKVYVTYVKLDRIHASSAANVFSEGSISASSLELSASSAASIEIAIDAGSVGVEASSAGDIVLEGKAKSMELEVSSAGEIDAYNLECEVVSANASSAGTAKVFVSKELEARGSSGGSIRYRGNPTRTNTDSSSGGSVRKTN